MTSLKCKCRHLVLQSSVALPEVKKLDVRLSDRDTDTKSKSIKPSYTLTSDKKTIRVDLGKDVWIARVKI